MLVTSHVDAIVGLQYGDEGKGKIAGAISESLDYQVTARYNGGANAGHTIVRSDNKRFELHQVPSSVVFGKPGHIGAGCAVDHSLLIEEMDYIKEIDPSIDPYELLTVSPKAFIVKRKHINLDSNYHAKEQGSTSRGIAPAYSDFYNRTATLFKDCDSKVRCLEAETVESLLLEGAQSFYLDPYQGNYPYTTSSHCLPSAAASTFGFDPRLFRNIVGVAKLYETRSGTDPNFYSGVHSQYTDSHREEFSMITELGKEYGVTTGRQRQIRYLDLNQLIFAVLSSGTNILVFNKVDVLDSLGIYKLVSNGELIEFENLFQMKAYIEMQIDSYCHLINKQSGSSIPLPYIAYSYSPKNDIDWNFLND